MIKNLLASAALILSVVNGLILLLNYLRDKPRLNIKPIHPEIYQWWFCLPGREYEGKKTRKYGFLTYVGIANLGLRKVQLDSWRLRIITKGFKWHELKAVNIPEPTIEKKAFIKILPVLGQVGRFSGETTIDSGCSILGMSYFTYECYGDSCWDPKFNDRKINGVYFIKDVFGNISKCKIVFQEKTLKYISSLIKDIETIE